jgi:hypothetical protein
MLYSIAKRVSRTSAARELWILDKGDRETDCRGRENRFSSAFYAVNNKFLSACSASGVEIVSPDEAPRRSGGAKRDVASYIALC